MYQNSLEIHVILIETGPHTVVGACYPAQVECLVRDCDVHREAVGREVGCEVVKARKSWNPQGWTRIHASFSLTP